MAKIDPTFAYDAYRFIIQGIRDADKTKILERFIGGPQTEFERTHRAIESLPMLLDPAIVRADILQFLRHQVGWDNAPEVAFVRDLNESQLRKLIKIAAVLWKAKGIPVSLRDSIRVFTGKNAILRDWFYHRLIIDEAGAQVGGVATDPFAVGGIFSTDDDELTWVLINRADLDDGDKELLHSLLTFVRPSGEHFGIVYAGFADDFSLGLGRWESVQGGDPAAVTVNLTETDLLQKLFDRNKAAFTEDANIASRESDAELASWSPYQRFSVTAIFSANQGDGINNLELRLMISEDREEYYSVKIVSTEAVTNDEIDVQLRIGLDGGTVQTRQVATINIPIVPVNPPLPIQIEIECAPVDQASNLVTVGVAGISFLQILFVGVEAYADSRGGVQLVTDSTIGASFIRNVDDALVIASPNQVQFVGQRAFAGAVADPDPGIEPFLPTPGVAPLQPHVTQSWGADLSVATDNFFLWTFNGFWHVSGFSKLGPLATPWFTDGTEVGEFPNQTVDPDYGGSVTARMESPIFSMTAFPATLFDCNIRVWYRPSKQIPEDGGATPQPVEDVDLQFDDQTAGFVTIATLPVAVQNGGTGFGVNVIHSFAPDADPRIGDGSWWQEVLVPANALLGLNAVQVGLNLVVNGTYVVTGFGTGVTYMSVEITRK